MTHLSRVLALRCVICEVLGMEQEGRTFAHHIRHGQGMGQRADDELTVPLCHEHHQGDTGIHGDRSAWKIARMEELDALVITIRNLFGTNVQRGKLHHGVPILRAEDAEFREAYDAVLKPLTYEQKLKAMDFWPVTSRMNTAQLSQYVASIEKEHNLECAA